MVKIKIEPNDFVLDQSMDAEKSLSPENDTESDLVESESAKSENDSGGKEVQFYSFGRNTVKLIAEQSIMATLTDSAEGLLAEDLSYRVRELIHSAGQFMKHSCRSQLTTKDVTKAMQELDCDMILGHSNAFNDTTEADNYYQFVPQAGVFVESDNQIDLQKEALAIVHKRFSKSDSPVRSKSQYSFKINWYQPKEFVCDKFYKFSESGQFLAIEKYFNIIFDIILTNNGSKFNQTAVEERKRLLKVIYFDLAVNKNIKPLFNLLIFFIGFTIRTWNKLCLPNNADLIVFSRTKTDSYHIYLNVLSSIVRNNHFVDIALNNSVVKELADILLAICLEPVLSQKPSSSSQSSQSHLRLFSHSLLIRSKSAHLFSQIFFRFCLPFTDTQHQLLSALLLKIRHCKVKLSNEDFFNISAIDYAILVLFRYLGFDMCLRTLQPMLMEGNSHFNAYFGPLEADSKDRHWLRQSTRHLVRGEMLQVGELVMKGLGLLLANVADDFVVIEQSDAIYAYYSQHFSDSLSIRLVPLLELPVVQHNRQEWIRNWHTLNMKTGKNQTASIEVKTPSSKSPVKSGTETSPTKSRKKKGSGLLESMLSTDTSKMPKKQSLSLFTESLLEATPQEKPLNTFLYMEDCGQATLPTCSLVVFEGTRITKLPEESGKLILIVLNNNSYSRFNV